MSGNHQVRHQATTPTWVSESISAAAFEDAIATLQAAVEHTRFEDVRKFELVNQALALICDVHPKGVMLTEAWRKALEIQQPGVRSSELHRLVGVFEAGRGVSRI